MKKRVISFQEESTSTRPVSVKNSAAPKEPKDAVPAQEFPMYVEDWLSDCQYRQHSKTTIATRRIMMDKVAWFLAQKKFESIGYREIKQFFSYLANSHTLPEGRWNNPKMNRPVRPRTVKDYYGQMRTFFRWAVTEGILDTSPIDRLAPPVAREDQVQPFSQDQVCALLKAAEASTHPQRDRAIVLLLLDSGIRASELVGLHIRDIDIHGRSCMVLGKGNKHRRLYFGRRTAKALGIYLNKGRRDEDEPLFLSDRGVQAKEGLTYNGLRLLIRRLGVAAKIHAKKCSPHVFRHTFAVEFLRAGGNVFSLKELLGHTSLHISNRYVALAQADIENQHRQFSPADRLKPSRAR